MQKQNNGFIKNPFLYLLMIFLLVTGFQYFFAGRVAGHSQQIKYSELVKYIDTHLEMDFMMVSSYHGGTVSSGVINIKQDVTQDIKGRHVVFVEDIIDTGQTLKSLRDMFTAREAASVKIVTMLDKPEGRTVEIEADYTCFTIPNEFVVGYGLDYNENYRNLPYVGVLKEEVYSK